MRRRRADEAEGIDQAGALLALDHDGELGGGQLVEVEEGEIAGGIPDAPAVRGRVDGTIDLVRLTRLVEEAEAIHPHQLEAIGVGVDPVRGGPSVIPDIVRDGGLGRWVRASGGTWRVVARSLRRLLCPGRAGPGDGRGE